MRRKTIVRETALLAAITAGLASTSVHAGPYAPAAGQAGHAPAAARVGAAS